MTRRGGPGPYGFPKSQAKRAGLAAIGHPWTGRLTGEMRHDAADPFPLAAGHPAASGQRPGWGSLSRSPGGRSPHRGAERRTRRKPAAVVMRELIGTGLGSKAALPCHRLVPVRRPWERPAPSGRLTPAVSVAGSGTSARRAPSPPVHPNPANPAPAGREARRTATRHQAMTWEKRQKGTSPSRRTANAQVKRQAKEK